ncbi:hypothetical protein CGCS363_v011613 [Colletotrichum siamense]|uniref:uncharacterized protein n=1 Tax=Colletotrichum siamense TaxID=690259 RepID=UPI0018721A4C|nr:uncharacterized protein CGCS363_v011613 [Colletotrichum siamense]KAF5492418.1 hypothetical protein CGCS363_v011613 [Colletotrichum siamense]
MGEMTMGWQVLSLRMTSAPQRDEDLRVAQRAVNAFSPKSLEPADGGGEKQTIPSWHSSTLDGWTGSHEELAAITTLEPDVVAIHQAVNRMDSQLKLYSYLQVEEVRRWDLAEEQKNQTRQQDQPDPVGVRVPAYLEMAREASSNEFLIRERDVNIDILEYLLHEREWQFYRNKTRGRELEENEVGLDTALERRAPHE